MSFYREHTISVARGGFFVNFNRYLVILQPLPMVLRVLEGHGDFFAILLVLQTLAPQIWKHVSEGSKMVI